MKTHLLLLFSICLMIFSACSDDDNSFESNNFELKLENGFIIEPVWLRDIIEDSKSQTSEGGIIYEINCVSVLQDGSDIYLGLVNMASSATFYNSLQLYRAEGTKIENGSDEYNKLFDKREKMEIIWTILDSMPNSDAD